jgi:tRNA pseudouridine38-40 synthase
MAADEIPVPNSVRIRFEIAYDGTNYSGWQWQNSGLGVQQVVEEALLKLFPTPLRLHSSSRTDTGVHAMGMVAHVDIPKSEFRYEPRRVPLALNANLPPDIRIMNARRVPSSFHSRFDSTGKQYRYFVWNHHATNPLLVNRVWHVCPKLDLQLMREAAAHLLGQKNFKSFATTRHYEMTSYVRRLTKCDIKKSGPLITFVIEGDGFLYQMCRAIIGTLVNVGKNSIEPSAILQILKDEDRRSAGANAPACGLALWKVFFSKKRKPVPTESDS